MQVAHTRGATVAIRTQEDQDETDPQLSGPLVVSRQFPLSGVFWVILGLGLIVRVVYLVANARNRLTSDAVAYHQMAVQLSHNNSFYPQWPPGLPLFLASLYRTFGASELLGRAAMLVFYVAFSMALYCLVRQISNARAASIATFIFALYPNYVYHSVNPFTELPAATCLVGIAYLTIRAKREPVTWVLALLGLVLGYLCLVRASATLLIVLVPLYLFLKSRRLRSALLPALFSLVVLLPWLTKAQEMTGHFVMINSFNSVNVFIGNNPYTPLYRTWWFGSHGSTKDGVPKGYIALEQKIKQEPLAAQDRSYLKIALSDIAARPDLFAVRTLNRVRVYFAFDTFFRPAPRTAPMIGRVWSLAVIALDAALYLLIMILSVGFLFGRGRGAFPSEVASILVVAAGYAIPYWLSFSHPSYHFPVVPLFGVFAAIALDRVLTASREWRRPIAPAITIFRARPAMALVLGLFAYVQIEWVIVMARFIGRAG